MTLQATGSLNVAKSTAVQHSQTLYIWLGTWQQLAILDLAAIAANFSHITFSTSIRDLGVTLDQELPLLLTSTVSTMTVTTSYASYTISDSLTPATTLV